MVRRILWVGLLVALLIAVNTGGYASAQVGTVAQIIHEVQPGDNLVRLAHRYGVSIGAIAVRNGLKGPVIEVGRQLIIPRTDAAEVPSLAGRDPGEYLVYVVRSGDYLGLVANQYGSTVKDIIEASNLTSPLIVTNQFLIIPPRMGSGVGIVVEGDQEKVDNTEGGEETGMDGSPEQVNVAAGEEDIVVGVSQEQAEAVESGEGPDKLVTDDETRMRQELQDAGYPYAFTESHDEIVRVYQETVNRITARPSGDIRSTPAEVITEYWSYVNERRYEQAWALLTDDFRNRAHGGEFEDYASGYNEMALCKVYSEHVDTTSDDGNRAVVHSRVTYETGPSCEPLQFEMVLNMEMAPVSGGWAIEAVAIGMEDEASVLGSPPESSSSRWIDIDISSQMVSAMEGDRRVRQLVASTGISRYPTVTGQFWIYVKHLQADMRGVDFGVPWHFPDVPYVMYFFRGYGVHGTYWHDNFGTPMSHGCINLSISDAEWLYNFSRVGTLVNIHY